MEWQPIETAPKDGSNLWLWCDEGQFQGRWHEKYKGWEPLSFDFHGCGCCGGVYPIPTHWMILPPPPVE